MSTQSTEIWVWREGSTNPIDGLENVEATDGSIGKIDEATYETGGSYVVVDGRAMDFRQEGSASGRCRRSNRLRQQQRVRRSYR